MNLQPITTLTDIVNGDKLLIAGKYPGGFDYNYHTVALVKVSESDGTEIILDLKANLYFNLGMYLTGNSWVTEVQKIQPDTIATPATKSDLTFADAWLTLQSFRYQPLVHIVLLPEAFRFDLQLYLIRIATKPIEKPTTVHQIEYINWMAKLYMQGTYYPIQFKVYELGQDDQPNLQTVE